MRNHKKAILCAIAVALMSLGTLKAQDKDQDTTAKHFLTMVSIGNLQEISAGNIAAKKASLPAVKTFGARMVADHGRAQTELIKLTKARGYTIPSQASGNIVPDPMLMKASGIDFDRVYIHMMLPGHEQTISLFQKYVIFGKDPQVVAFAKNTLPVLKEHLQAIKGIDEQHKYLSAK